MVGFLNGVGNGYNDCLESSTHLGILLNHNVMITHSGTFGPFYDYERYLCARFGFTCEITTKIHESWNRYFDKNPDGYIFWVCHSRGAVDTANALATFSEELRQRIVVVAVAPGGLIDPNLCHSVVHLIASEDLVPRLDPYNWSKYSHTFKRVQGSSTFGDHSFNNEIYADPLAFLYRNFLRDYK